MGKGVLPGKVRSVLVPGEIGGAALLLPFEKQGSVRARPHLSCQAFSLSPRLYFPEVRSPH